VLSRLAANGPDSQMRLGLRSLGILIDLQPLLPRDSLPVESERIHMKEVYIGTDGCYHTRDLLYV
jgi:hypothetical protein